jgi:hypothetical protein
LGLDYGTVSLPSTFCQDEVKDGCNLRRRRSTSSFILPLIVVSQNPAAISKALQSPEFALGFAALTNMSVTSISARETAAEKSALMAAGRVYGPMDSSGQFHLLACAPGFLLVNDSISSQDCYECLPGTYSLDFMDGCSSDADCKGGRPCNKCPAGALCPGQNHFVSKLKTAMWSGVYRTEIRRTVMMLISCPEGILHAVDHYRFDQWHSVH